MRIGDAGGRSDTDQQPLPRRHCFGAFGSRAQGLCWADESTLAYLCGQSVVLYQPDTKAQRFVAGSPDAATITAIAVCPSRRLLALAERGDKATVTVFDLQTLKRRKILTSSAEGTKAGGGGGWRRVARPASLCSQTGVHTLRSSRRYPAACRNL